MCRTGLFFSRALARVCFAAASAAELGGVEAQAAASQRATSSAVLSFVVNSVGLGVGPQIVGIISDVLNGMTHDPAAGLRWALLAIVLTNIWSAAHYLWGMRTIRADMVSRWEE